MTVSRIDDLPDGHRLYHLTGKGEAINPDYCWLLDEDDGDEPTDDDKWVLDPRRPLRVRPPEATMTTDGITATEGMPCCMIPVIGDAGERSYAISNMEALLLLSWRFGWGIVDNASGRWFVTARIGHQ